MAKEMKGQISFWDLLENIEPGDRVKTHGAVIPHIMRSAFIGKTVVVDKSTQSMDIFVAGILEGYIPYGNTYRSIVYIGEKQRQLITHMPGVEIFELQPWSECLEKKLYGHKETRRKPHDSTRH